MPNAENGLPNLRLDPQIEAVRSVLRDADDAWMPGQSRALFERLWDIVGRERGKDWGGS